MSLTINAAEAYRLMTKLQNHPLAGWLQSVADQEEHVVEERIRTTKRNPDGEPWAPWRPMTARLRTWKGTVARGILYDEGALLASIVTQTSTDSVRVGATVDYAKYLQEGRPNMVAREFLGWSDVSLAKYEHEALLYLEALSL